MKLKALFVALAAAALCASVAYASPPPGKGHQHGRGEDTTTEQTPGSGHHAKTPAACKGRLLLLTGAYVSGSADGTGAGTFAMLVKHAAGHGKGLDLRGKQATVTTDAQTKVRRHGQATIADLVAGDRLVVLVRACRAAAGDATAAPTLLALGIVARPAKGDGTGTTTTGTTTDDTTTTDTVPKTGTGPSLS